MSIEVSPLAPANFPELPEIGGLRMAVTEAGVKYRGRTDLWLAEVSSGASVSGVFTRSKAPSAPVDWCRRHINEGRLKVLMVNSGNANAFTGSAGIRSVEASAFAVASQFGCEPAEVYLASTGVIGEPLPARKLVDALPALGGDANAGWLESARAIMTTDTFPKGSGGKTMVGGVPVAISGICKGSGMIEPDMATMLGFLFTDLNADAAVLQSLLDELVTTTFNAITVDSDTSTSDTVLLVSTCQADHPRITDVDDPGLEDFRSLLNRVMEDLAVQIVRDGEGASKLIQVDVEGAENDDAAKVIAKSIANSPLVKTAIAGEDANWGRVVMAVGKAGEMADRDRLCVSMGGIEIAANGAAVDHYDESVVNEHLKGREVSIAVNLQIGDGCARVWTCDLTEGYIRINADYRS